MLVFHYINASINNIQLVVILKKRQGEAIVTYELRFLGGGGGGRDWSFVLQ